MKKIISVLLLAGICNFSFAQSSSRGDRSDENVSYSWHQNGHNKSDDRNRSVGSTYGYNNQRNQTPENDYSYRNSNDGRNRDTKQHYPGKFDRRDGRGYDRHERYSERKASQNKNAKAFGSGLLIGGILGVLIGASR